MDHSLLQRGLLLLHLLLWLGLLVVAPWVVLSGWDAAVLFACYHFTAGLCFGAFSQVNHLNQDSIAAASKVHNTHMMIYIYMIYIHDMTHRQTDSYRQTAHPYRQAQPLAL